MASRHGFLASSHIPSEEGVLMELVKVAASTEGNGATSTEALGREHDPVREAKAEMYLAKAAMYRALAKKLEAEERYWDCYASVRDVEEDVLALDRDEKRERTKALQAVEIETRKAELERDQSRFKDQKTRIDNRAARPIPERRTGTAHQPPTAPTPQYGREAKTKPMDTPQQDVPAGREVAKTSKV